MTHNINRGETGSELAARLNIALIRETTLKTAPLIHCITNPISINDCANTVLLTGAKPIMAEHPKEAAEITGIASALAINLGNITDARLESIRISAAEALRRGIPSIIDMVGITCSSMRLEYVRELLLSFTPSVIKGNLAEIKALCSREFASIGIDAADNKDISEEDCMLTASLARQTGCTVMATGKTDIISDGEEIILVKNGSPKLTLITGTGCMLNVLTASFLPASYALCDNAPAHNSAPLRACAAAAVMLGICGELAEAKTVQTGLGSFHIALLDELSSVTDNVLSERADAIRLTVRSI